MWQLTGSEARHAKAVLRLRTGDSLILFNGQGVQATATIIDGHRDSLSCRLDELVLDDGAAESRSASVHLTLAIALPKGDRQRVLIDALTELGVHRIVPVITRRGVAQPTDKALERLQRAVVEACKQCGRNRLMEIAAPCQLADLPSILLNSPMCTTDGSQAAVSADQLCLVAHPYDGPTGRQPLINVLRATYRRVHLLIGPEGGLSDDEVAALVVQGWQVVDLSQNILRIEIAAMAAAAQILGWYRGQ